MAKRRRYGGFSLIEVLLAIATLAIGMMFIGGTFLAGVYFSTVSTEQTIASVVANEALSKIRLHLYDANDPNRPLDLSNPSLVPLAAQKRFEFVHNAVMPWPINPDEFAYPSTRTLADKQYYWSALCRKAPSGPSDVYMTVFVSRKVGTATGYVGPAGPMSWPVPMPVGVSGAVGNRVLTIEAGKERWIGDGYTIVEDSTGQIFRVVERGAAGLAPDQITLDPDKPWLWNDLSPRPVWVVPPPLVRLTPLAVGGGGPCIAVYQKLVRF